MATVFFREKEVRLCAALHLLRNSQTTKAIYYTSARRNDLSPAPFYLREMDNLYFREGLQTARGSRIRRSQGARPFLGSWLFLEESGQKGLL